MNPDATRQALGSVNTIKSRTFASIARIGGYLVNLFLALMFDLEINALGSQFMIFLSFAFPMVAELSYHRMERNEEAT